MLTSSEQSTRARIRLDLVGHEDGDVELFCHMSNPVQVQAETLLTRIEFTTPHVVDTEKCTDAVDD